MLLSAKIKLFKDDLENYSENYCMTEVIDKLEEYEDYAFELEEKIDELRERLKEYEEED